MAFAIGKGVGGQAYAGKVLSSAQGELEHGIFTGRNFFGLGIGEGGERVGLKLLKRIHSGKGYKFVVRARRRCAKGKGCKEVKRVVFHSYLE